MPMDAPIFETHESMTELEGAVSRAHEQLPSGSLEQEQKAVIRDVVKEHTAGVGVAITPPANDAVFPPLTPSDRTLLEIALASALRDGLDHAVKNLRATHDPRLLDLFHDLLTDHFYDKLVASGKLDVQA